MAHKHYSTGARSPTSRRNIWRHLCGPKPRKHYADSHLGSNGFGLNSPRVSLAQEGNRDNEVIRNTTTALDVRHRPDEDNLHILRCPDQHATEKWQDNLQALRWTLQHHSTAPSIVTAIIENLQAWHTYNVGFI